MVKLGIMQPYFFPYIGYYQLLNFVDRYVIYDNIEFTRKGWINRNRILVNGKDELITLPLRKDSDFLHVRDRALSDTWPVEKKKMLNRIAENYRKSPFFDSVFPFVEHCMNYHETNLFRFLHHSILETAAFIGIDTPVIKSSEVMIDHQLKSQDKVLGICQALGASSYINPIGGVDLYDKEFFQAHGIELNFLKAENISYRQFSEGFCPNLSIIDVLMFNSPDQVRGYLNNFSLL
jgi:WbqC-like protein family